MYRPAPNLRFLSVAVLALLPGIVAADYRSDIGHTRLQQELGITTPDGTGIRVAPVAVAVTVAPLGRTMVVPGVVGVTDPRSKAFACATTAPETMAAAASAWRTVRCGLLMIVLLRVGPRARRRLCRWTLRSTLMRSRSRDQFPGGRHFADVQALNAAVLATLPQLGSVLVKGSRFMKMERVVQAITGANLCHAPGQTAHDAARAQRPVFHAGPAPQSLRAAVQVVGSGGCVHCGAVHQFQRGELLGLRYSAAGVCTVLGYCFH